jgi:branched-subunit amino acid transport protein
MSQFEAVLLLGMGVITFAIRYTLFAVGHRVRFSPLVQQALGYVPVAVLTAIIVPAVVMPDGNSLQLTLTIFGSMLVFFLWRWWLAG